jgi:hypothetical protein
MSEPIDITHAQALIEAHLAHVRFERVVDYLRRGRRFAGEKFYRLKFDWRDFYTRFDEVAGTGCEWTRLHDLEAELALRYDTVPRPYPARHAHGLRREQHARRLWGDPVQWDEAEHGLYEAAHRVATATISAVFVLRFTLMLTLTRRSILFRIVTNRSIVNRSSFTRRIREKSAAAIPVSCWAARTVSSRASRAMMI